MNVSFFEKVQRSFYSLMDRLWDFVPTAWKATLATIIILVATLGLNGNWLFVIIGLSKQFEFESNQLNSPSLKYSLEDYRLQGLPYFLFSSILFGYCIYFPLCGFLQWYFYVNRRENPFDWKCQPRKFLSWQDEKHEIIYGSAMLTLASVSSGLLSCYIHNGGYTTMYYKIGDYGWTYFIISTPTIYLVTDISLYFAHRMFHIPFLYRHVHKVHHRYKQPTPFSSTAMHPVEFYTYQIITFLPIFTVPVHWSVIMGITLYMFYYGIIDHSGIKIESIWPWQPSSVFHDNHHQYFHVNFGLNVNWWDKLFGTYRIKERIYNENIFYGKGTELSGAKDHEIKEHLDNIKDD